MTDEEECIEYLLSQCPAFAPHWKKHRAPYGNEPTPGGLMLDLAAFGRYAAGAIERDAAAELATIAEAAERLVDWPSDHVQTAAVYGFLEGLTNRASVNLNDIHSSDSPDISARQQSPPAEILTISGALKCQACEYVVNALRPPVGADRLRRPLNAFALDAYVDQSTRWQRLQKPKQFRNEVRQGFESVGRRDKNYDRNGKSG